MEKYEIEELMEKRGFSLWATLGGKSYQFLSKNSDRNKVINCFIYPDTLEFEFKYLVPYSVIQLSLPKCSPFTNEEHFLGMLNKFLEQVDKLCNS